MRSRMNIMKQKLLFLERWMEDFSFTNALTKNV
jgi:hypothetical protein